ncbi:hypothetical protein [Spiroplasma diminutum]|uniref:Transmembrane protein n=1 Tax=Spiroplasma diminutum CUAS-1 TaxID=1276221 RepID=S5M062_9MOLU|nr:hypothetical protein [Spiroplasma diminutum]AGR42226.1 hypothetical protein SDIMI_v3c05220 [Spiroplasma diminutum CUAS-1]
MNKDILIILLVFIWLLLTLITGILALIFKEKFKDYKIKSTETYEILKLKKEEFTLKETKIGFELPKDEICYYFSDELILHKIKLKNKNAKEDYKKELKETNFSFSIYVTNKRLMVQLNDHYIQYDLKSIVYCNYLLIYVKKQWKLFLELEINDDKYIMKIEDFNLMLTIEEITKKEV